MADDEIKAFLDKAHATTPSPDDIRARAVEVRERAMAARAHRDAEHATPPSPDDIRARAEEVRKRVMAARARRDLEKAEAEADFREPKYSFGDVLRAAGGETTFVRNWIDRGTFTLDANAKRVERKHRRFSYRDAIIIALAVELSRQGIAPSNAERASEMVSKIIEEDVCRVGSDFRSTVRFDFSVEPPAIARPDGPCVGIVIDIRRLQDGVSKAFGGQFMAGTIKDMHRLAAEKERSVA
jgi:hypothetical protein